MFDNFIRQNYVGKKKKKSPETNALEWLNRCVFDSKFTIRDHAGEYGIVEYKYIEIWNFHIYYVFEIFGFIFFEVKLHWKHKGYLIVRKSEDIDNINGILMKFFSILEKHKLIEPFVKGINNDEN